MPQDKLEQALLDRQKAEEAPSFIGKLMQLNASVNNEARQKQVKLYTEPNSKALPEQKLRPSSLTKFTDRPFYSMADYLPAEMKLPPEIAGKLFSNFRLPYKLQGGVTVMKPGDKQGAIPNSDLSKYLGLGRATTSIGMDEANKPYLSIFDSWDFDKDTAAGLPPLGWFLRSAGKPYNIYDRVPFELEAGKIPEILKYRK